MSKLRTRTDITEIIDSKGDTIKYTISLVEKEEFDRQQS
jgi:hypothetical protein